MTGGATPVPEVPADDTGMRAAAAAAAAAIDTTRSPSHRKWDGQWHRAPVVAINVARMLNPTSPYAPCSDGEDASDADAVAQKKPQQHPCTPVMPVLSGSIDGDDGIGSG